MQDYNYSHVWARVTAYQCYTNSKAASFLHRFIFYRKRQKDIEAKDSQKSDHPIVFEAFNRFIKVIRCVHTVFA